MANTSGEHHSEVPNTVVAQRRKGLKGAVMNVAYWTSAAVASTLGASILWNAAKHTVKNTPVGITGIDQVVQASERALVGGGQGVLNFVTSVKDRVAALLPQGIQGDWNWKTLADVNVNIFDVMQSLSKMGANLVNNPADMLLGLGGLGALGWYILNYTLKKAIFRNTLGFLDTKRIDEVNKQKSAS